ncbi:MAG: hypothetical protein WEB79_04315 [Thermoleophilaceae bacterium]
MDVRNEKIGFVVSVTIMVVGTLLAGGDLSDQEGAVIMSVAFLAGIGTITALHERERRQGR